MNKRVLSAFAIFLLSSCTGSHLVPESKGPGSVTPPSADKPAADPQFSSTSYLRKLSLHIRGLTPSRTDYEELERAEKSQTTQAFLREKIATYLTSDEHIDKMTLRLEELFFLRPSELPANAPPLDDPKRDVSDLTDDYTIHNSLNEMFREIAGRNMSWDSLLTGKRYLAFPLRQGLFGDLSDPMFLATAAGAPKTLAQPLPVTFDDDDTRVAGSLTTSRFFNRYGNTALNKNRRRAAAVFRIFLCDDMKAVVVDEAGNQDGILDKVFPNPQPPSTGGGGAPAPSGMPDRHGSDPACMKCHSKLDPLGLTFQASGLVLSPFASPGALVYPRSDGSVVNIHARGLGELAAIITKQKEYAQCQVQHFWNWFVGVDVPLDPVTMAELTRKFDEVDRRTNDFIAYLVERPEFSGNSTRTPDQELASQVKGVLQNCNGCHSAAGKGIPSFTDWPIGGSEPVQAAWFAKIRNSLGLDGAGKGRWMPPKTSAWQPSADQLDLIKRWFAAGTPGAEVSHEAH